MMAVQTQPTPVPLLTYVQIRERLKTHALKQFEIPIEHAVSLPIPTLKFGEPGYAMFASPATRWPGTPVVQGVPDRWAVLAAKGGRLLIYAVARAMPFSATEWVPVTLPNPNLTMDQLRQLLADVDGMMTIASTDFFQDRRGPEVDDTRRGVTRLLGEFLPPPLMPQYRELAADFFHWLQA